MKSSSSTNANKDAATTVSENSTELRAQDTRDRINKAQQNKLANLRHGSEVPKLEHRELQGRIVERVAKNAKFGHGTVSKVKEASRYCT